LENEWCAGASRNAWLFTPGRKLQSWTEDPPVSCHLICNPGPQHQSYRGEAGSTGLMDFLRRRPAVSLTTLPTPRRLQNLSCSALESTYMSHGLSPLDVLAWAPPAYQAKPGRTEPAYQKHATTHTMSAQKIGKRRLMTPFGLLGKNH
jgi:hypothetical protein